MLKLQNITIQIDDKIIIKNLSFKIKKGEIHYLMGPNGSGKSTLALAIMGYPEYKVEGDIIFEGQNITQISPDKRAKLGLFLSMQYPPAVKGVTILSLLKNAYKAMYGRVNVLEFRKTVLYEATNLGLKSEILSRYVNDGFSGGEKKRLELLQLIILKPKLAILDEPDSGLDIDAIKLMSSELDKLSNAGMTFLIITHLGNFATKPNRVTVIKNGVITEEGGEKILFRLQEKGFKS
ncbi:MAG: Fe-S cluster assembly ATPase SufC [Candidatus Paceibacterota bacterium]